METTNRQETKALLQRDLARQTRRDADAAPTRLDSKALVESAWQRAKLEMETDDLLDVLADNPSAGSIGFLSPSLLLPFLIN